MLAFKGMHVMASFAYNALKGLYLAPKDARSLDGARIDIQCLVDFIIDNTSDQVADYMQKPDPLKCQARTKLENYVVCISTPPFACTVSGQ